MKCTPCLRWLALLVFVGLTACETAPPKPAPEPVPVQPVQPVKPVDPVVLKEQALTDALSIYADGQYEEAMIRLTPLIGATELPLSSQVKVLKFMAFSQCALGRTKPCRQQFEQALELDPTFQLTEAEKGHPVWGREFSGARAAVARHKRAAPKSP
jgi:hypothetical protein